MEKRVGAMEERVLVVGAGLVGSLLALFLARLGCRVELCDRRPDPRTPPAPAPAGGEAAAAGRSINLTICERGFTALDRVGAGDAVRAIAVPCQGRVIHNLDGGVEFQPYGTRGEAIHSVSRGELNRTLLALAVSRPGIECAFDEKCLEVDLLRPAATFNNVRTGEVTTRVADRLIGADGAYSQVRLQMQRTMRFDYAQEYLDQAYVELRLPAIGDGASRAAGTLGVTGGRGGLGGWALARNAIHIWPRGHFMLIGFPNRDATFTVALHMPYEGRPSFAAIGGPDDLLALFRTCFADALPLMPTLVDDFFARKPTAMITVRCFPWTAGGKVALVGDAAHAIVPSYGQGANAGFEDCSVLADCLAAAGGWPAALADYERRRKPNAEAIADLALEHFTELRDRVGDPEFLLRKEVERRLCEIDPERFMPLYALVSFTNLPYVEALARGREQEKLISRVMAQPRLRERLDDEAELRRLLEPLLRDPGRAAVIAPR